MPVEDLMLDELDLHPRAAHLGGGDDQRAADPIEASLSESFQAASLLVRSCSFAETHFGLRVAECSAPGAPARWGPVHRVHSAGSFHYRGRAADISGNEQAMRRFCAWAMRTHLAELAELIHNPGASVDTGRHVPASFWGSAWAMHTNHVHLAI